MGLAHLFTRSSLETSCSGENHETEPETSSVRDREQEIRSKVGRRVLRRQQSPRMRPVKCGDFWGGGTEAEDGTWLPRAKADGLRHTSPLCLTH